MNNNNMTSIDEERFATFGKSMMTTTSHNGIDSMSILTYDNNPPSSYLVGSGGVQLPNSDHHQPPNSTH